MASLGSFGMIFTAVAAMAILYWAWMSYAADKRNNAMRNNRAQNSAAAAAVAAQGTMEYNNGDTTSMANMGNDGSNANSMAGDNVQPAPPDFPAYALTSENTYFGDYPRGGDPMDPNGAAAYGMNLSSLMPASWRSSEACPDAMGEDGWSAYAPTKMAFDNYITAAGSARLGLNTRTRNPTGGVPYLLRPSPPVPMSGSTIAFNDSGFRQDMVYNSMGFYPTQASCA